MNAEKTGWTRSLSKNKSLLLMVMPATIYFIIFSYLPMLGMVLAFKNYNYTGGIFGSPWSGLENFKFLLIGGQIFKVARNTFAYNIVFLVLSVLIQVPMAIFLAEVRAKYFKKVAQSMMFMPYFISWVVVGSFLFNMFNFEFGSLNTLLKSVGLQPVDILNNVTGFKYVIIAGHAWKWVGYGSVIYLAAIMGLDSELYQAAIIDGAGKFKQIRYITLPLLVPQIFILSLISIGNIFRGDFQMFYQLTGNNPILYEATDVIDTFVIRSLLQLQDFGMASAGGFVQSILCFVILIVSNYITKRYQEEYALF